MDRLRLDKEKRTHHERVLFLFSVQLPAQTQALTLGGSVSFEVSCRRQATALLRIHLQAPRLGWCTFAASSDSIIRCSATSQFPVRIFTRADSFHCSLPILMMLMLPSFPLRQRKNKSLVCLLVKTREKTSVVLVCMYFH